MKDVKLVISSIWIVIATIAIVLTSGCNTTPTQNGAMGGAAIGGIAGQLLGGDTKSTMIGAGAGALLGGLGNDALHQQKTNSYNQGYNKAAVDQRMQQAQQIQQQQVQQVQRVQPQQYVPVVQQRPAPLTGDAYQSGYNDAAYQKGYDDAIKNIVR